MKFLEVKAIKAVKKLVAAEVEKKTLEAERPRALAGLLEAEDILDEKAVRQQKAVLSGIDERLARGGEKIKFYRQKGEKICLAIIQERLENWRNGGREVYRQQKAAAEQTAGEHLGKAVAILELIGPEHAAMCGHVRSAMRERDPRVLPLAAKAVSDGFLTGHAAGPGEHDGSREFAAENARMETDPHLQQNAAKRLFSGIWREQRQLANFDGRPRYQR